MRCFVPLAAGLALGAFVLAAAGPAVLPHSFPIKPNRMDVLFPPGGTTDVLARAIGHKMGESWGQQIVVENRGGAAGMIGTERVAREGRAGEARLRLLQHRLGVASHRRAAENPCRDRTLGRGRAPGRRQNGIAARLTRDRAAGRATALPARRRGPRTAPSSRRNVCRRSATRSACRRKRIRRKPRAPDGR